jgi:hypothetical protein
MPWNSPVEVCYHSDLSAFSVSGIFLALLWMGIWGFERFVGEYTLRRVGPGRPSVSLIVQRDDIKVNSNIS